MHACSKREYAPVLSENIEPLGIWICRRVPVGRRQKYENRVTRAHGLTGDNSAVRSKAARVLYRRIVTKRLLDGAHQQTAVRFNLLKRICVCAQRQQRIANQSRGGLVCLGQEANAVGQNYVEVFLSNTFGFQGQRGQQSCRRGWL